MDCDLERCKLKFLESTQLVVVETDTSFVSLCTAHLKSFLFLGL